MHTPALLDVNDQFRSASSKVVALRQKVNILSDDVILAWQGSYTQACSVFKEVAEELKTPNRAKYVSDIVREAVTVDNPDLTIIGFARGESKTKIFCAGRVKEYGSKLFSNVIAAGSGADDMATLIRKMEGPSYVYGNQGVTDYANVILRGIALSAQAMGLEHLTFQNLWALWGGGVEIALFDRGKARKAGNLLHTFWDCSKQEDGLWHLRHVPTFIKMEYQGDVLVTRTLSETEVDRICIVAPLLSSHNEGEKFHPGGVSLSYDWLCSSVVARVGERSVDVLSHVQGRGVGLPLSFIHKQSIMFPDENTFHVRIAGSYINVIREMVSRELQPGTTSKVMISQ